MLDPRTTFGGLYNPSQDNTSVKSFFPSLEMKKYFPEMFYVRGEDPASILHLLPDSVARKNTCFTSDAHPAMTPTEAL